MAQVFAGFVCGYLLALLFTPLLAVTLVKLRTESELVARILPPGVPAVSLGVVLHGALFLWWTMVGILLGLVLLGMKDGAGALGSRNLAFSLLVFSLTLAVAAPVVALARPLRRPALLSALAVLLVFGWLMPYMAAWSTFPD